MFSATAPQVAPAQGTDGDFTPGAWDRWAPWLDGSIHPKLHDNTDATPLVSIVAVLAGEVPASEAGLMRGAPAAARPAGAMADQPPDSHTDAAADAATGSSAASATLAPAYTASAADIAALVAALPRAAAEPSLGAAPSPVDTDAAEPQADDVRVHIAPRSTTPPEAEHFAAEPEADGHVHFAMTRESPAAPRGGFGLQLRGGFLAGLLAAARAIAGALVGPRSRCSRKPAPRSAAPSNRRARSTACASSTARASSS
ncbi:MAG: hypothetical protein VB137_01455 [Burkholderia sp.]